MKILNIITTEFISLLKYFCCLLGFHSIIFTRTPIENTMYNDVELRCTNCDYKHNYLDKK